MFIIFLSSHLTYGCQYIYFVVQGVCINLPAGDMVISLRAEIHSSSYFRAGFATYGTRLFVEELSQTTTHHGTRQSQYQSHCTSDGDLSQILTSFSDWKLLKLLLSFQTCYRFVGTELSIAGYI